uniref:Uncharacterized protein n=1 Tax=Cacopsylla melanoneura TaxID=428564 RepID=A0A8D8QS21_9HEMI
MVQAVFNLLFALNNRPMEKERKSRGYSWDTLSSGNSQKMKQSLPVSFKMSHFIALTEGQTSINLLGKSKMPPFCSIDMGQTSIVSEQGGMVTVCLYLPTQPCIVLY